MNFSEISLNDSQHIFDSEMTVLIDEVQIDKHELQIRKTIKMVFCVAYAFLFIFGTLGNGIVIVMICNILTGISRNCSNQKITRKLSGLTTAYPVFIYVLGLSIVDFLVILHLPLLISEMLNGQWIFGNFLCKLYWYGESVNKLLSSFLMTVLSWDRYMAVCSPFRSYHFRKNSVAITVLISCSVIATLLLYPVLKDSTVLRVDKLTGFPINDDDLDPNIDRSEQIAYKCIFDTNTPFFMLYTFLSGYVIPALLITFFYLRVILKLRSDALRIRKHSSDGQVNQVICDRFQIVTKRIVAVVLFYFFCWTPYWTLNILSQFNIIIVSWSTLTLSSVFFSAHLLVCFNSAVNPVLYALINRELRQQHKQTLQRRKQSMHAATSNALEFFERCSNRIPSPIAMSGSSNLLSQSQKKPLMKESRDSIGCPQGTRFGSFSGIPQRLNGMRRLLTISSFQELSFSFSQASLPLGINPAKTTMQNHRSTSTTANTEISAYSNTNSNTSPAMNGTFYLRRNTLEPQCDKNHLILKKNEMFNEEKENQDDKNNRYIFEDEDCFL